MGYFVTLRNIPLLLGLLTLLSFYGSGDAKAITASVVCKSIGTWKANFSKGEATIQGKTVAADVSFDGAWIRVQEKGDQVSLSFAVRTGDLLLNGERLSRDCIAYKEEDIALIPAGRGVELRKAFLDISEQARKYVQRSLSMRNLYDGHIDGLWGRGTEKAILSFVDANPHFGLSVETVGRSEMVFFKLIRLALDESGCNACGLTDEGIVEMMHGPAPAADLASNLSSSTRGMTADELASARVAAAETERLRLESIEREKAAERARIAREEELARLRAEERNKRVQEKMVRLAEVGKAKCLSQEFKLLELCASQTPDERRAVITARGYECNDILGFGDVTCILGDAVVMLHKNNISFNCNAFNVCGLTMEKVAAELMKAGIVKDPKENPDYRITRDFGQYCARGDLGDVLCVGDRSQGLVNLRVNVDLHFEQFNAAPPPISFK